jgi:hypothetical protein
MGRRKLEEQQTTLSIRISDALRKRLDRVKRMISESRGDSVSLSEAAKWFLESAQDERVEAAELLSRPTDALATMYRKWDQTQKLSRADWIVLSHYVQIGCEEPSDDPRLPRPESFATVILAFLAVRRLRTNPVSDLDHFFLGNLESPSGQSLRIPDGSARPEYVPTVCREILDVLRKPDSKLRPVFVGRNLHVALRDERGGGIEAINQELQQFWTTLWRLAARGHWLREKHPIRPSRPDLSFRAAAPVPPVEVKEFRLSVVTTQDGDIAMLLEMSSKHISYPLSPYPTIREFATMVSQLQPGKPWHGSQFSGVTHGQGRKVQFLFRDRGNGITIDFSEAEWNSMGELFENALGMPQIQPLLDALAEQYGEV